MFLSARQANQLAAERQQTLVRTVLEQSIAEIVHNQEGPTIWDEAVQKVRAPQLDLAWTDANLGVWMRAHYGHDESFVLDSRDRAIYAMQDGKRVAPDAYGRDAAAAAGPLVARLRHLLREASPPILAPSQRSPGVVDLGRVSGHPSIVSVKPIVSDTGEPRQVPGQEYLHVTVRWLDTSFATTLTQQYLLQGAHFAATRQRSDIWQSAPLATGGGQVLGYLSWRPFSPGAMMIRRMAPYAIGALLLTLAMVAWLLHRIHGSRLQLHASRTQAQHLAFHDALTGLANRARFDERLTRALAEAQHKGRSIALLYFDLDRFKHVNDTLGHPAGDELICTVAKRLVEATRATDVVARIGGDEFAIVQTDIQSAAEAEVLCMRIVEAVSEPFTLAGNRLHIGVSIGVALAPAHAGDRTELARKADIALYEAKAAGRGRYVFFAETMDASIRHRREVEHDLRMALASGDELELVYQPLYAAQGGRITGAEALVRWHHPEKGVMAPSTFVPIAEATGLIEPLGEWVLERACADAARLRLESISVNLSAVQLRNEKLAERVLAILDRTRLDPARLELEITETSFIESAVSCQPNLAALRAKGVRIALDDFGTGYSSFSHLRHFDVDRIKIDQSFVTGIDMREGGSAIIQAIVDLAKASGMQVTAEGVETAEQRSFLSEVGCNALQGYLLSRPIRIGELRDLLEATDGRATVRR